MTLAATASPQAAIHDPVCGMEVDAAQAEAPLADLELQVAALDSAFCAMTVEPAVRMLAGIGEIMADGRPRRVTVDCEPTYVSEARLRSTITASGDASTTRCRIKSRAYLTADNGGSRAAHA